jgi:type I restriction enzyme S subunit
MQFISREKFEQLRSGSLEKGDLVYCLRGSTIGKIARVDLEEGSIASSLVIIRAKESVDQSFLFYYLYGPTGQELVGQHDNGSAQPNLSVSAISKFPLPLPPLPEQKAIAHILGTLDDKIELNRRMNATLEAMAQALFKSWFVDFDPVIDNALAAGNPIPDELAPRAEVRKNALANATTQQGSVDHPTLSDPKSLFPDTFQFTEELGWIPEGWDINTIGSTLDTMLGGTPARKNANFWQNGTIGWINSGKVNEFRITEPSELITDEALAKSATKLLPKRTTVLAITGATLGQVSLTEIECCANQSVIGILGTDQLPSEYIYSWINQIIDKLVASQTGGAQQHINKGNVQEANILLPNGAVLDEFIDQVRPAFDQIALSCFESESLTKLRDTLLPKLVSGDIRISEAEQLTA